MDSMKDESNTNLQQNTVQTIRPNYQHPPVSNNQNCCGGFT
jgi:hypothetical protein